MRDFKTNRPEIFEEIFFRSPDRRVGREFNPRRTRQLFPPGKLPGRIAHAGKRKTQELSRIAPRQTVALIGKSSSPTSATAEVSKILFPLLLATAPKSLHII